MANEQTSNPGMSEEGAAAAETAEAMAAAGTSPGDEGAGGVEPAENTAVPAELVAAAREEVLRAQAEVQNVRRRAEKEVENARRFALERFAAELLPVMDNLDRTLDASGQQVSLDALLEGVQLTRKSFLDVLGRFNIQQIEPVGEPFDPGFHEAVAMVPNPDAEPNSVLQVVQKGYLLNGRVIRAAMVLVAAPPPKPAAGG